ncbi:bifunctional precorrin-2 dehydrogenase/sirohydrochlorin ferrochelatase [Anaerovoracaceae bacterium 42-11]|nr:bifunctional precorrin-2 dehydrogenase/sirohydrochlorin ferrochelatase [Emergencia sp.]
MKNRYFPVFVPSEGKKVAVFGGGNIATRRVRTLLTFDFAVTVVAPDISAELKAMEEDGKVNLIAGSYEEAYLDGCYMVLACTDNRQVNKQIGADAKKRDILVSVCDNRAECTFYFPAVAAGEEVTAGICGSGRNHGATKRAAAKVREIIKGKAY